MSRARSREHPKYWPAEISQEHLQRFLSLLQADGKTRPGSTVLWEALALVFPHRQSGTAERQLLLNVLHSLEATAEIRLPAAAGKRWDRTLEPAVPLSVDLLKVNVASATSNWRGFPWHPDLQWVAKLRSANSQQLEFLKRVHEGFVQGMFLEPASLRHRSLQLTGDEKRLEQLLKSALFAPGRLSTELLGCLPDITPLAWERVGRGGRLLIVENAGAFSAARRAFSSATSSSYGLLAYGSGRAVEASIGYLLTLPCPIGSIDYLGDLDAAGLTIFQAMVRRASELGLPPVQPAAALQAKMFQAASRLGHPAGWPSHRPVNDSHARKLTSLLPEPLSSKVARLLTAGRRIPEEVLGAEDWLHAEAG